ncbi:MAG TPA: hypothetical protein VN081_05785 [Dongiaceae bacterium]|nr:hypothetical protein [Dongiaceae bacterium]
MHPLLQPNTYRIIWIVDFRLEYSILLEEVKAFQKRHAMEHHNPEELVRLWVVHILHRAARIQVDGFEQYFELWNYGFEDHKSVRFAKEILNSSRLDDVAIRLICKLPQDVPSRSTMQTVKLWLDHRTLKLLFDLGYYFDANHHPTTRPPETARSPFGESCP